MSKEKLEHDELDKVNEVLSSSEQFVEKYQKPLLVTVLIIILVVAGFLSVRHFYFQPREVKAQAAMYKGEIYFAKDSFELALKGNGLRQLPMIIPLQKREIWLRHMPVFVIITWAKMRKLWRI